MADIDIFLDFLVLEEQLKMPGHWFFFLISIINIKEQVKLPANLGIFYKNKFSQLH